MKEKNAICNRREFLTKSLGTAFLASAILPTLTIQSCEFDNETAPELIGLTMIIDLNDYDDISSLKVGWGLVKRFKRANNGIPVIIVRTAEEEYKCFSSLCTHDNCVGDKLFVQPRRSVIACSCHGSEFDAKQDGKVILGPAERPLRQFKTKFYPEEGILSIWF